MSVRGGASTSGSEGEGVGASNGEGDADSGSDGDGDSDTTYDSEGDSEIDGDEGGTWEGKGEGRGDGDGEAWGNDGGKDGDTICDALTGNAYGLSVALPLTDAAAAHDLDIERGADCDQDCDGPAEPFAEAGHLVVAMSPPPMPEQGGCVWEALPEPVAERESVGGGGLEPA